MMMAGSVARPYRFRIVELAVKSRLSAIYEVR
jgi:hypothetical protein